MGSKDADGQQAPATDPKEDNKTDPFKTYGDKPAPTGEST